MKLSQYCKKIGISYITGYRWFQKGTLPVDAYQTESGSIFVEDDIFTSPYNDLIIAPLVETEAKDLSTINAFDSADIQINFLQKAAEFSTANVPIEDFANYVVNNYSLIPNNNFLTIDSNSFNTLNIDSTISNSTAINSYHQPTTKEIEDGQKALNKLAKDIKSIKRGKK